MNLNKVFLLGRLTADPNLRTIPSGQQVATFSIATNRIWNDKTGARREDTEYHNIVVWGRQAEIAQRFLAKGGLVLVEGRMQTRSWEDKQGQKRKTTEIVADRMQLGPKPFGAAQTVQAKPAEVPTIDLDLGESPSETLVKDDKEIKPEDLDF